ncbi:MAG: M23 family metallopeptidase [Pseudomonadota bacterium]
MKLIVLKDGALPRALRLSAANVALTVAGVLVILATAGTAGYQFARYQAPQPAAPEAVTAWQQELARQQETLGDLDSQAQATSAAVGRQLSRMQARLLRMEAIGSRVVKIADLDADEFSFVEEAPQGGPVARETVVPLASLQTDLDELAMRLATREQELEMLASALKDRKYRKAAVIGGRPVKWGWLSSNYGNRVDPISGKKAWHAGVDFAGKDGSDVIAVASGVVTFAGKRYGYGLLVEINHGDGYSTRYAHHKELKVVSGDVVKKGQTIGLMGSSGRSTGPHVHFEVLKNGRHVNPAKYVATRR